MDLGLPDERNLGDVAIDVVNIPISADSGEEDYCRQNFKKLKFKAFPACAAAEITYDEPEDEVQDLAEGPLVMQSFHILPFPYQST